VLTYQLKTAVAVGTAVAGCGGPALVNAPGGGTLRVVNAHHAPPFAAVVTPALTARTCQ